MKYIMIILSFIFTINMTAQTYEKIKEFQRVDTTWNVDSTQIVSVDSVFNTYFKITDTIQKQNENNFTLRVYTKDSIGFVRVWQKEIADQYNAFGSFEAKKRDFIDLANKLRTELAAITGDDSYLEDVKNIAYPQIEDQYKILFNGTWHHVTVNDNGEVLKGQNKVAQITPYSFKYIQLYIVPLDVNVDLYSNQGMRFEGNDPTYGKVLMLRK